MPQEGRGRKFCRVLQGNSTGVAGFNQVPQELGHF